ncbi:MAG: SsrA-binding protein SmpB [Patescibacteria group bacterium]
MTFAENRKARYDYEILETFEGGLALSGQEVKSIREGGAKIDGAYLTVSRGELWLLGGHIKRYSRASPDPSYDPAAGRKILIHAKELTYVAGKTQEKGLTLVPLSVYSRGRRIKLSFGLCRGRKTHDIRERLKARDLDRTVRRALRGEDVE